MNAKDQKPNIFDYSDFRLYLRDYQTYRKKCDRLFTKSFICKQLGLPNSRSHFQDVLNGKLVSDLKVPLFIKLLELNKDEARFFRALIAFNQALDDPDERELLFDQLISLNRTPKTILKPEVYSYYKAWYHGVIRALLQIVDITDDYGMLASLIRPKITKAQVVESVNLLLELGLVAKGKDGVLRPTQKVISTGAYAQDELIRQFQMQWLSTAQAALLKQGKMKQRFITKTISVSGETLKLIEKKIEKFNAEINSMVHKDQFPADRAYHLSFQLFPISELLSGDDQKNTH